MCEQDQFPSARTRKRHGGDKMNDAMCSPKRPWLHNDGDETPRTGKAQGECYPLRESPELIDGIEQAIDPLPMPKNVRFWSSCGMRKAVPHSLQCAACKSFSRPHQLHAFVVAVRSIGPMGGIVLRLRTLSRTKPQATSRTTTNRTVTCQFGTRS